jgi:hypothetical protein
MNDTEEAFDLTITPEATEENFLLPELAATQGLAGAVASGAAYLHRPAACPDDLVAIGSTRSASRQEARRSIAWRRAAALLEKSATARTESGGRVTTNTGRLRNLAPGGIVRGCAGWLPADALAG